MHNLIRYAISIVLFLVFLLHIGDQFRLGLLDQIENFAYDARIRQTMPNTVDPKVVIVDLDEKSLKAEGQWPWPRTKLATLIDNMFDQYDVKVVGFDIVFAEPDRGTGLNVLERLASTNLAKNTGFQDALLGLRDSLNGDGQFARSLEGRNVVMGYVFSSSEIESKGLLPEPAIAGDEAGLLAVDFHVAEGYTANLNVLQSAAKSAGFFDNPSVDADGVFRRVPLVQKFGDAVYTSLALEVARLSLDAPRVVFGYEGGDPAAGNVSALDLQDLRIGDLRIPVNEEAVVLVPYRGRQYSFPYVSASDVIRGTADPAILKNAVVLVGTSAPGLLDLRSTPVGKTYAGVEVHANIVSGILEGRIKHLAPYVAGIEAFILLSVGLFLAWLIPRVAPLLGALAVLTIIAVLWGIAHAAWQGGDFVLPLGTPIVFTIAVFLCQVLYGYFVESRSKREISKLFGQYVPPELVDEMADHPKDITMESDSRDMTVLFSDVRGFTTISEGLEPQELTDLMNSFLTPLTGVIHDHRGTIDKYMGDAIMAFWGAPLTDELHARHSLDAGMDMVKAVRQLDDAFKEKGWPLLQIGVGLNTGEMSVGNMGSEFRMAYTVLGDAVNLGSRLEGLTKEYGVYIICSETTKAAVKEYTYRELDKVRVKGKNEPVAIFEPMGLTEELASDTKKELSRYRQALRFFRAQEWDKAEQEFFGLQQSGHKHKLYEVYMSRIAMYRQNPPGEDWDGVFTHTSK